MATPETDWILPQIDMQRCTGCGLCAQLCPTHAVEVRGGRAEIVHPAACSFCDVCESYCPEGAIMRPFTIRFATYAVEGSGETSPPQDSHHPARLGDYAAQLGEKKDS